MNIEPTSPSKKSSVADFDMEDFDFKPITSGLGFSHQKTTTEIKPAFVEKQIAPVREVVSPRAHAAPVKAEMNVYQNDLSLFYGQNQEPVIAAIPVTEEKSEKIYRPANKVSRVVAYVMDMAIILGVLSFTLFSMSKAMDMRIFEAWSQYPDEITPLVVTLFCGFYILYFAIAEKSGTTFGKSLMNIRVVSMENKSQDFMTLVVRTLISLANFASLGLFSYFDLQNKATNSKVIKVD